MRLRTVLSWVASTLVAFALGFATPATVLAEADACTITGTSGDDELFGGKGSDTMSAGQGADVSSGGAGSDFSVVSSTGNDSWNGGAGRDHLTDFSSIDSISGGPGNDTCARSRIRSNASRSETRDDGDAVPGEGVEPSRAEAHGLLRPARLPVPPSRPAPSGPP